MLNTKIYMYNLNKKEIKINFFGNVKYYKEIN